MEFGSMVNQSKCLCSGIDPILYFLDVLRAVYSNGVGAQDFATYNYGGGRNFDDEYHGFSAQSVCETEVSPLCPYGWAYYADADGSEGADSCVYISPSTVASWSAANSSCPGGSHLLTVQSASSTSGLLPFATSLYHGSGQRVYIGCRCVLLMM